MCGCKKKMCICNWVVVGEFVSQTKSTVVLNPCEHDHLFLRLLDATSAHWPLAASLDLFNGGMVATREGRVSEVEGRWIVLAGRKLRRARQIEMWKRASASIKHNNNPIITPLHLVDVLVQGSSHLQCCQLLLLFQLLLLESNIILLKSRTQACTQHARTCTHAWVPRSPIITTKGKRSCQCQYL